MGELRPGRDTGSGMEAAGVTPNLVFGEGAGGGLAKEVDWNPVVVEPDLELACNEALPRPLGGASLAGGEAKGELFAAGEEPEVGVVRSTLGAQSAPHATVVQAPAQPPAATAEYEQTAPFAARMQALGMSSSTPGSSLAASNLVTAASMTFVAERGNSGAGVPDRAPAPATEKRYCCTCVTRLHPPMQSCLSSCQVLERLHLPPLSQVHGLWAFVQDPRRTAHARRVAQAARQHELRRIRPARLRSKGALHRA